MIIKYNLKFNFKAQINFYLNNLEKMRNKLFVIISIFIIITNQSLSWWDTGHMLVAEIAKQNLQSKLPEAVNFIESITKALESQRHKKITNFVESATWPDFIKKYGIGIMDNWHFYDVKYDPKDEKMPYIEPKVLNASITLLVSQSYLNLNLN